MFIQTTQGEPLGSLEPRGGTLTALLVATHKVTGHNHLLGEWRCSLAIETGYGIAKRPYLWQALAIDFRPIEWNISSKYLESQKS